MAMVAYIKDDRKDETVQRLHQKKVYRILPIEGSDQGLVADLDIRVIASTKGRPILRIDQLGEGTCQTLQKPPYCLRETKSHRKTCTCITPQIY